MFDNITVHVRGLEALGTPSKSYGNLLIPMSRMPKDTTLQVARKTTVETWDIAAILAIVRRELEANEISSTIISAKKPRRLQAHRPPSGTLKLSHLLLLVRIKVSR